MTAIETAMSLCRGSYQRDIVTGRQCWSGADLVGEARQFAGRYRASRKSLLRRLLRAGVPARVDCGAHGRLTLVIG